MKINRTEKIIVVLGMACRILLFTPVSYAQDPGVAVSYSAHQKILNEYKKSAEAFCAKNLNRFGLEQLKKYDKALDSMSVKEKADTLATIQKEYLVRNSRRISMTDSMAVEDKELSKTKNEALLLYNGLLRKAAITLVVWLAAVLLLLKFRNRAVRNAQLELDANLAQLKTSEDAFAQGNALFKAAADWQLKAAEISRNGNEISKNISKLNEIQTPELIHSEPFKSIQKNSDSVQTSAQRLDSLATIILRQQEEPVFEKQTIQINQLCDHYSELAYSEMLQEDGSYSCQLSKDFEKNLPTVSVTPEPVGNMLLYILSNAFNSVKAKQEMQIKGFIGKVSISTRILPRFIQIRIKDNGVGIPDEAMESIYEAFYSTQPVGRGAGLGLYFCRQVIQENNGEMKIESDHENATDVYIKFFLKS